jgi:GNAT superfamily N-acetyltransferase
MTSVVPFEPNRANQVLALWRRLHPDWTWLNTPEVLDQILETDDAVERICYVVQKQDGVIASVFSTCWRDRTWPRNRFIQIEARPADLPAAWLDIALASFVDADRGQPDIRHVANQTEILMPVLAPLLEAAGFVRYASVMQMEWRGESVTVPDSGPAHIECYAGGDLDIDRAIVDLHNWAYRPAHLVPPADLERLWKPRLGVETREYVLAMENGGRVVGYAEWLVRDGNAPVINSSDGNAPAINSIVVARSHWGTAVAAAVLTRAMQILLERGHTKIESWIRSNNAASMRLARKLGWKVASEKANTFVRKL